MHYTVLIHSQASSYDHDTLAMMSLKGEQNIHFPKYASQQYIDLLELVCEKFAYATFPCVLLGSKVLTMGEGSFARLIQHMYDNPHEEYEAKD